MGEPGLGMEKVFPAARLDGLVRLPPSGPHGGGAPRRTAFPLPLVAALNGFADVMAVVIVTLWLAPGIAADHVVFGAFRSSPLVLLAGMAFAALGQFVGAYDQEVLFSLRRGWARILTAWCCTVLLLFVAGIFFNAMGPFSWDSWMAWLGAGCAALATVRAVFVVVARRLREAGVFHCRTAIFGADVQGQELAQYIMSHDKLTLSVVGFYDDSAVALSPVKVALPFLGGLAELVGAIRAGTVDRVIIALPWAAETRLRTVVEALALTPVQIRLAPERAGFIYAERPVTLLGGLPVMTLLERPISGMQRVEKWLEDRVLAFLLLLFTAPLMLLIALAIRLESGGPILFRQAREGFNCRTFSIFKFRTMYADRGEDGTIHQARRKDPRVTRVGAFLRRTSLDELPQLLNVLMGQMSLVGPRPHAPATRAGDRLFGEVVASYAARHKVKPGLTGWAQVCGWRGETDTEEKLVKRLEHDLYYIENWSLLFDLYILVRTVATVLTQKNAY